MVSVYQPRLRTNVVANFLGRISGLLLGLLFTPLYIHYLGIEAYGLIGFYLTLQGSMTLLEMGLSRTCNRELARYSGQGEEGVTPMRHTLRTLEMVYWLMALLIGTALTLFSPLIAEKWITTEILDQTALTEVIITMVLVVALRWPIGVYQGALMGLQRHVRLNLLQVGLSLLSAGGVTLVLAWYDATITSYFRWQLIATALGVVVFMLNAWRVMPEGARYPRFSFSILKNIYRFAAGVGANAVLGTILRQADKLILSGLLPMKQFAYYALATLIAQTVAMIADTVSSATFPRFSQMVGSGVAVEKIAKLYHFSSQLVAVLIIPFALALAFFAQEALYVYTGDQELTSQTATILSILVIAKMLHACMIVPYGVQLAYGWVKLSIWINVASVVWLIPALYFLAELYGAVGAAVAWLIVTIGYVLIGLPLMHRKLLPGEAGRWFTRSFLFPVLIATLYLIMASSLDLSEGRWILAIELIFLGSVLLAITALVTKTTRVQLFKLIYGRNS